MSINPYESPKSSFSTNNLSEKEKFPQTRIARFYAYTYEGAVLIFSVSILIGLSLVNPRQPEAIYEVAILLLALSVGCINNFVGIFLAIVLWRRGEKPIIGLIFHVLFVCLSLSVFGYILWILLA
jgi:hypothetical protein